MRDGGGVLTRAVGTEEKKKSYEARRKTTENLSRPLHSLTKVAAREDDLDELSRDTRTRRRLADRASFKYNFRRPGQ